MMTIHKTYCLLIFMLTGAVLAYAEDTAPELLFQKALTMESAKGDYKGAIPVYEEIIRTNKNPDYTLKAVYRLGLCYEKTGDKDKSRECALRLKHGFPEQVGKYPEIKEFVEQCLNNTRPLTGRDKLIKKLNALIIPQIEFRQANIVDVVNYLVQTSAKLDTDDEKGINIILNIKRPATTGGTPAQPAGNAEPSAVLADMPTVTLSLKNIVLMDAIKYVTEVTGLKYRIEEEAVVITPSDVVYGEVITRAYSVEPSFVEMSSAASGTNSVDAANADTIIKKFFVDAGVPFPEGTSIAYKQGMNKLIVSNTADNLDKLERILTQLNPLPVQVKIEVELVEITDAQLLNQRPKVPLSMQDIKSVPPDKIRCFSRIDAITKSGQQTQTKNIKVVQTGSTNASCYEIGATLDVTPVIGPDGYTIDVTFTWSLRTLDEGKATPGTINQKPIISEKSVTQGITIWDGESLVIAIQEGDGQNQADDQKNKRREYLIVTVSLIDPAGHPIKPSRKDTAQKN